MRPYHSLWWAAAPALLAIAAACGDSTAPTVPTVPPAIPAPELSTSGPAPMTYTLTTDQVRTVVPLARANTVVQYYSYNTPHAASANTPDHLETSNAIEMFLHQDSNTGAVSLVIIIDKFDDGTGGTAAVAIDGLPGDASWSVKDDPGENAYLIDATSHSTQVQWTTFPCCTDGGALSGSFDQPFDLTISFPQLTGINRFDWVTDDGSGGILRYSLPVTSLGSVRLQAEPANHPPVAVASAPAEVVLSGSHTAQASLDGSASTDDDGDPLSYSWSEAGSEIATGANPTVTLGLGSHVITLTVSDGQASSTADVTVDVVDQSPPVVTPVLSGTAGSAGWYRSDVALSWNITDPESDAAIVSGCAPATATDGSTGYDCKASSAGGETDASVTVNVDTQMPDIVFAGNAGSYGLTDVVDITCSATDAGSGIATATCPQVSGQAYTLGIGSHTLEATATDVAGNSASASTTFQVVGTIQDVADLVNQWVSNGGVANALIVKLLAADRAGQRGNDRAAAGAIGAFRNQVRAVTGKWLTAEQANFLLSLF